MRTNKMDVLQAVQQLGGVLDTAQKHSLGRQAWQKLQVADETGETTLPAHTQEAVEILEKAHRWNEEDHHIVHHLAVVYHSSAWDLERQDPARALPAWEKALYYWKKIQNSGAFWQELCSKGKRLGGDFNEETIHRCRKNLMRPLLEIHVRFILHYYETQKAHWAAGHIRLIRKAQISPADRKYFEKLVYGAMTSTVPDIAGAGRFLDALSILEDFLALYPSYPPALQRFLEIAGQQLEQLSPAGQWSTILQMDTRITKKWLRLNKAEHFQSHPLAQSALLTLAETLAKKHFVKAKKLRNQRMSEGGGTRIPGKKGCSEYKAYKYAIQWLERAKSLSPSTFDMKAELHRALLFRADFVTLFCLELERNEKVFRFLEEALTDCTRAMDVSPDNRDSPELAGRILEIRAQFRLKQLHLKTGLSNDEFAAMLKQVEADLEKALQFKPGNQSLPDMLKNIRDGLVELKTSENHDR